MDPRIPHGPLRVATVIVAASAWLWLAFAADGLPPYARGCVDGVRFVVALAVCAAVWRSHLATRRRHAVEVSGRKARWLAKHPDSVVGRG